MRPTEQLAKTAERKFDFGDLYCGPVVIEEESKRCLWMANLHFGFPRPPDAR